MNVRATILMLNNHEFWEIDIFEVDSNYYNMVKDLASTSNLLRNFNLGLDSAMKSTIDVYLVPTTTMAIRMVIL